MSSCHFDKNLAPQESKTRYKKASDTVRIANDSLQYEVIIIDPGFNSWLASRARPRGFYSESFLENRNQIYSLEWNSRVLQPQRFNPNLYEMQINYETSIHYGYEVNYLIYNYFMYFQITNKQALSGFVPRP
jgi:hypothetical protein